LTLALRHGKPQLSLDAPLDTSRRNQIAPVEARRATLIDDTKAKNQLVIVDICYDSSSTSGRADAERIMKSVQIK
jgi:hypothetical protein